MNKFYPFLYILIPVKDRAEYLYHTLRTIEIQNYSNLRVIVSDDGSRDNTRDVVEAAHRRDSRIVYVTPGSGVGMKKNFEFALDHAKQGYVMFLGGDDGLMPGAVERLIKIIELRNVDLITWNPPIYTYPGSKSVCGNIQFSRTGKDRYVSSNVYLERQAKFLNYIADEETPMIYVKGAASVELINRIRKRSRNNEFYQSPTPDGYSGIVLAGEVEKYWFEKTPISIYGVSPSSQGMGYLSADEKAKRQSQTFFEQSINYHMSCELANQPYSPLISLMTADYLLTAKKLEGWPGKFGEIDYSQLIANSINELANGLYASDRVVRELEILDKIATHHNLKSLMMQLLERKFKYVERPSFDSDGANFHSLFMSCNGTFIDNIFDAAYFAQSASLLREKITIKNIIYSIKESLYYKKIGRRKLHLMSKYLSGKK
jgi:hypothetical protein